MLGKAKLDPQIAFGQALREARKAAGFSQEGLGLEAGVERNFVSLIETGKNQPTITTIFKLAQALGCIPSDLVRKTEELVERPVQTRSRRKI